MYDEINDSQERGEIPYGTASEPVESDRLDNDTEVSEEAGEEKAVYQEVKSYSCQSY